MLSARFRSYDFPNQGRARLPPAAGPAWFRLRPSLGLPGRSRLPDATPLLVTHRTHGGQPLALEITHLSADGAQLAYTLTATTQETTGSGTGRS